MRFLNWVRTIVREDRSRGWERGLSSTKAKGDFRGSYGFGRRAHCPDPNARYTFGDDPTNRMHTPGAS